MCVCLCSVASSLITSLNLPASIHDKLVQQIVSEVARLTAPPQPVVAAPVVAVTVAPTPSSTLEDRVRANLDQLMAAPSVRTSDTIAATASTELTGSAGAATLAASTTPVTATTAPEQRPYNPFLDS